MSANKETGSSRGCFRNGCIGCLVVVGGPIVLGVLLALINLAVGTPDVSIESRELSRQVEFPAGISKPGDPSTPLQEITIPAEVIASHAGRVVLNLSEGKFTIVPGAPGEPIRVEGEFDTGSYELTEQYSPSGELGWTYQVDFGAKRSLWLRLFSSDNIENEIRIVLPRDIPISLQGSIGLGETEMELGGLWLLDADLEFSSGEHQVRFSEPLLMPARSVAMSGSYGVIDIDSLGNASPERAVISHNAGQLHVGLDGNWRNDSSVDIKSNFGELRVGAPGDARLKIEDISLTLGEKNLPRQDAYSDIPPGAPTVHLSVSLMFGDLRVR